MKKILTISLLLLFAVSAMSQTISVKQSDYNQIRLSFATPDISVQAVSLLGSQFCSISLDGFSSQSVSGKPALPTLVKTIEVPLGDGLKYDILAIDLDTLDGNSLGLASPIAPAQPSRSKSDRSTPSLVMNNATYSSNAFCGEPTIVLESAGIARNRNLATIAFNPISWNPVTNQIIIVRNISVAIRQTNSDIEATKRMKILYASGDFGFGIETLNSLPRDSKEARRDAPVRYTIIANSMFQGSLEEFADWKRRKGFIVDLLYTDNPAVGSSSTSISNFLKNLYDNATETEPAPTYVLLVGDVAQIPAFQLSTQNSHYSDLNYVCWSSGDKIPDAYIGRFSAQSIDELTPQISKTLMYEQYTFPDDSYLGRAVLIAGVDGGNNGDFGYTHADPTMDYVAHNYVNASNGFSSVTYYKNNTSRHPDDVTVTGSSQNSSTATALRNLYNSGIGWANYSAHGDQTLWHSPSFTVSNVAQMSNYNMPMIAIGNCCLTNSFQISTCLGEAFLRKGNNAGAVGYIGASEVTYWDEDVYWSMGPRSSISATMRTDYNQNNLGMYDQLFHSHGESFDKWHISLGAMMFAGNMAVQSSSSSTAMKNYYWEVYHLMGDPSLMPYIHGPAQTMTINTQDVIPLGQNTLEVQCAPYAYVALTDQEHNLIAASYADANGNATLTLGSADNIQTGSYELAVSAQGYKQEFRTITIMPVGTYVKAMEMTPLGSIEAGKPVAFNVTIKNIGIEAADNIWIEFRNPDNSMLIDSTGIVNLNRSLNADDEITLNGTCSANVWNDIADQTMASIRVTLRWAMPSSANSRSSTTFRFPINAAKVVTDNFALTTPFDSTNTAQISISSLNNGHAALENAHASLLSLDPSLTISGSGQTFTMLPDNAITKSFAITTTESEPINRVVPMLYTIANNEMQYTDSINVVFGQPFDIIDFEDSTWGSHLWTQGSNPWEITSSNPYQGTYCMRSKEWSNNAGSRKTSDITLSVSLTQNDSISFFYRVSSEEDYDRFSFYIDNSVMLRASGESDWTRAAFYLTAGTHDLRFSYSKDYYLDEGEDGVFIDNISLPIDGVKYFFLNDTICTGTEYTYIDTTLMANSLGEGTHQFSLIRDNKCYNLTLTVVPIPQATVEGGDVTITAGESVRLTANGGERYIWNSGERHPVIDVYPIETTTYTVTTLNGHCSADASTTITIDGALGINSQLSTLNSQLSIFPNPAHNMLTIEASDCNISQVIITDIVGHIEKKIVTDGGSRLTIDITNLPNGIHIIQASTINGKKSVSKFIKQ